MKLVSSVAVFMGVAFPLQATAAAVDACLTREEAKGLAMFILPDATAALRDKCRATLPASAYLNRPDASERFRPDAERRWPTAKLAFAKFAGKQGDTSAMDLLGDGLVRDILAKTMTAGIARDVKPKSCAGIDRMLAALAPLPPANLEMLLDSFFLLGLGNDRKTTSRFKICTEDAVPLAAGSAPSESKR